MAASPARLFDGELITLLRARTHRLKSAIWPAKGAEPKITKKKIGKAITRMQALAEKALLSHKHGREILSGFDHKKQWHPKRGKGHGTSAKKRNFKLWYERHITTQNCVYVFWNGSRCLYVGRTLNGKGRATHHFEKNWFGRATRLDVYGFERRRDVPRFECMFTHKHQPVYSRMKPSRKRHYSRCPVCEGKRVVRDEIKSLFRLK